jgi:hypothetical protein
LLQARLSLRRVGIAALCFSLVGFMLNTSSPYHIMQGEVDRLQFAAVIP